MLRITRIEPLVRELVLVGENGSVNEVGRVNNKIEAKFMVRKNSAKFKSLVKLIKLSSELGFFTPKARLA